MAYVITDSCIKDSLCVEVCPTDCVHPSRTNPVSKPPLRCMWIPRVVSTVAHCIPACTSDSIHAIDDVPEDKKDFVEKNAAFYKH